MRRYFGGWALAAAVLLTVGAMPSLAEAAVVVGYTSDNSPTTAAAAEWHAGVTPLPLSRGAGLSAGTGATFNTSGWTDEATDYLEWGWSNSPTIDLTDLDLRYDRSASGPSSLTIALSVNGGAFQNIFTDASVNEAGEDVLNIDLSTFLDVTSATFRLFGTGASSGTGTFDIESLTGLSPARGIVVNGVVTVPEPNQAGFLASIGGIVALRLFRRRSGR